MHRLSMLFMSLTMQPWLFANGNINDFKIGIELCDQRAGQNTGTVRYTKWFRDSINIWSLWTGDSNYHDPDGIRIGLLGQYNNAYSSQFNIENTDIKFCIQLTDHATNYQGNDQYNGYEQCTSWASAGGGWSSWAGDSNNHDFDAVRIKIMTRNFPGLTITDVKVGVKLTDGAPNDNKAGTAQYSDWLVNSQSSTWSGWAGDSNFYDPDYVKIYAGFRKSITDTASNAKIQDKVDDVQVQNTTETQSNNYFTQVVILSIIGVVCLVVCFVLGIYGLKWFSKGNYENIVLDDDSEVDIDEVDVEITGVIKNTKNTNDSNGDFSFNTEHNTRIRTSFFQSRFLQQQI
eukprot:13193_1